MEVLEAIYTRRSIRRFLDVPVEWDKVGTIVDAGRVAPSAGNLQAWKFVIVRNPAKKKRIAEACLRQYWMEQAPVFIVIFSETKKLEQFYGLRGARLYSAQDCSMAAMQMMLAAHALSLGACFVSAFDEEALSNVFALSPDARPQGVLVVGYADERPEAPLRYRIENICWIENFNPGNPGIPGAGVTGRVAEPGATIWNFRVVEKSMNYVKDAAKEVEQLTRPQRKNFLAKLREQSKKIGTRLSKKAEKKKHP